MQGGGLRTTNCESELAPTYRPRSFSRRTGSGEREWSNQTEWREDGGIDGSGSGMENGMALKS